jgi:phenylacetate-CoA ligase
MISPVEDWVGKKTGLAGNLDQQTLQAWQLERLRETVEYARQNTAFYSGLPASFDNITDLPFTKPADLVTDPLAFLAIPRNRVERVTTLANSGTTNLRKRIFFSKGDLERTIDFFTAGMSTMVKAGDHAGVLISNKTENSLGRLLQESLMRIGVTSRIAPALRSADEAIETARGADCLVGMPAELLYLSKTSPCLRPRTVLLAADLAPRPVIAGIRDNWNCDVYTHYGHTEFGFGCAVDCSCHDGLHLRNLDLIFEIIDLQANKPVKPGEAGEIVITTVSNEAMPLIRYRTGNISRFITSPCGCSSSLNRLNCIEGRISNNISLFNGRIINIYNLDEIIFSNPGVRSYDAYLHKNKAYDNLQLVIDSSQEIDLEYLKENLLFELNFEIKYQKTDPFTHRGKRHIIIND